MERFLHALWIAWQVYSVLALAAVVLFLTAAIRHDRRQRRADVQRAQNVPADDLMLLADLVSEALREDDDFRRWTAESEWLA